MGDYSKYLSHAQIYRGNDVPTADQQKNLRAWAQGVYDPFYEQCKKRVGTTSVYRGPAHNAAIGGAPNSDHLAMHGCAAGDVYGLDKGSAWLFEQACILLAQNKLTLLGAIGLYEPLSVPGSIVHLGMRPRVGGAITTWYAIVGKGGGWVYKPLPAQYRDMLVKAGLSVI
jgi:hypothetical protein